MSLTMDLGGATDRFKYAANVVSQTLKSNPPAWYWYGSFTGLTRFLDTFAWRTVWVRFTQSNRLVKADNLLGFHYVEHVWFEDLEASSLRIGEEGYVTSRS